MGRTLKAATPFAGLVSFFSWLGTIGYAGKVAGAMPFGYQSPNAIPLEHALTAFLSSVLVGASRFAHSGWLRHDSAPHAMLGITRFPGKHAIRRFFHQFTQARIEAFWRPLWIWLLGLLAEPEGGFTLDLDSTIFIGKKARLKVTTHGVRGTRVTTCYWPYWPKHPLFFTRG